jgi:membrane-associated phospholipid phosphatase
MPDNKVRFGVLGAGLAIVFLCLTVLANGAAFKGIDDTILRALRIGIGQKYHALLSVSSVIGSAEFTALVVALVFAYAYFCRHRALVGQSLFPALFVIEFLGKSLVYHPGPSSLFSRQSPGLHLPGSMLRGVLVCAAILVTGVLVHVLIKRHHLVVGLLLLCAAIVASVEDVPFLFGHGSAWLFVRHHPAIFPLRWLYHQMEFSFPSGHMARTTFVCLSLLALLTLENAGRARTFLGSLLVVLFLTAMSVSLMRLGYHWFSDVLGGITLGASMASLAVFADGISQRPAPKQPESIPREDKTWAGGEPDAAT